MKSLFDKSTHEEIITRLDKLSPQSQRQWGKMEVAQMLAHCKAAFMVPLSEKKLPRAFVGIILGWAIKKKLYNDDPWKQNLPTAPHFKVTTPCNFEREKQELTGLINAFYTKGPEKVGNFPHPFFGNYTKEQWGKSMYKHLDHHLTQFGA